MMQTWSSTAPLCSTAMFFGSPSHVLPWPHPCAQCNTSLYNIFGQYLRLIPVLPPRATVAVWDCPTYGQPCFSLAPILHCAPNLLVYNAVCVHPSPSHTHTTTYTPRPSFVRPRPLPPGSRHLPGVPLALVHPSIPPTATQTTPSSPCRPLGAPPPIPHLLIPPPTLPCRFSVRNLEHWCCLCPRQLDGVGSPRLRE